MQGTCSPFWPRFQCHVRPLRRAILTAVLLHHKVPMASNPLRCLQGVFILADLRVDFFIFLNIWGEKTKNKPDDCYSFNFFDTDIWPRKFQATFYLFIFIFYFFSK